ncbi:MAG: DUF1858 domain-containing protein [Candidatus Melainabacteria bacterium]|nr:DUF1858 domain-containing protein [Candidatus Melainabacteria bacterium]
MNAKTRLSVALAAHPDVLEYIISLNPHDFGRLRNPLMQKVMPMRITLGRLAAMVGMPVTELVSKIHEIAGLSNTDMPDGIEQEELPRVPSEKPAWMIEYHPDAIKWVDVTPLDAHLGDPMPPINIAVNTSKPGEVIGIKHMWEPQPLFDIWHSRGFEFWTEKINPDLWHVYVYHPPTR